MPWEYPDALVTMLAVRGQASVLPACVLYCPRFEAPMECFPERRFSASFPDLTHRVLRQDRSLGRYNQTRRLLMLEAQGCACGTRGRLVSIREVLSRALGLS